MHKDWHRDNKNMYGLYLISSIKKKTTELFERKINSTLLTENCQWRKFACIFITKMVYISKVAIQRHFFFIFTLNYVDIWQPHEINGPAPLLTGVNLRTWAWRWICLRHCALRSSRNETIKILLRPSDHRRPCFSWDPSMLIQQISWVLGLHYLSYLLIQLPSTVSTMSYTLFAFSWWRPRTMPLHSGSSRNSCWWWWW